MFVDVARIRVKGGDGGDGAVHFRREKYIPAGGPDGGDGGRGGHVIFEADHQLSTLLDFRYRLHYEANSGQRGEGKNRHGRDGEDLVIKVPVGTLVRITEPPKSATPTESQVTPPDGMTLTPGLLLADLVSPGQRFTVARGGKGGRGNSRFTTSTRQAPGFSERGVEGEELWIQLELKLLADVSLVGYPNAGKSLLISRLSAARPKVAHYPFTTLVPNLGVAQVSSGETFVVADVPGLIEGAHQGIGLGHDFLRHIERTRLIVHVVDVSGQEGRSPVDDFLTIQSELVKYREELANRPQIVAANKMDLPESKDNLADLQAAVDKAGLPLFPISAATTEGVEVLKYEIWNRLKDLPRDEPSEEVPIEISEVPLGRPRLNLRDYEVTHSEDVYVVDGSGLREFMKRIDFNNDVAMRYFQRLLGEIGVHQALEKAGVQEGDIVRVGDLEFEYVP